MSERTIVALGCSPDHDYAFLLPLTAMLWRRIGFEPLALIVGRNGDDKGNKMGGSLEWATDKSAHIALDAIREQNINVYSVAAADGYPYATTAQAVRQHAAALTAISSIGIEKSLIYAQQMDIADGDWLMPADTDLWPIGQKFYTRHQGSPFKAVSYYWNGDNFLTRDHFLKAVNEGKRSQTLPTCHVAMRVRDWRLVYDLTPSENLESATKRTLDAWYAKFPRDGFNTWMSDQDIMTYKLCSQSWFPQGRPPDDGGSYEAGEVLFVGRRGQPPVDRLDRSHVADWNRDFNASRWVDAHLPRSPWSVENWVKLRRILEALLPDQVEWANEYRLKFAEAMK